MSNTRNPAFALTVAATFALAACSGSNSRNAAPRVTTIPEQDVVGGTQLSLDLSDYVTDREQQTLTYTVVSGGGSFSGSTYTHTFDTLGTYTVTIRIADPGGEVTETSFDVDVNTSNFAVVEVNSGDLRLLDTDTRNFLEVASNPSFVETYKTALGTGILIYERTIGSNVDLYAYDPYTRITTTLGNSTTKNERYQGKTSDGRVVFTSGTTTDPNLYIWDSVSGLTREISALEDEAEGNVYVNSSNLVFYRRTSGAQGNLYYYDPAEDESVAVSTEAADENYVGLLANGGVVFTRLGSGGEKDLFYFRVGIGTPVEVGGDLSTTVKNQTKAFAGGSSTGHVVFTADGTTATSTDIYAWNPANGTTATIATSAATETVRAVTANDEVVYTVQTGVSNDDLMIFTLSSGSTRTIANSGSDEYYLAADSAGDVVYIVASGTGNDIYVYDTSANSSTALGTASTDDYAFGGILANDDIVFTLGGGSPALLMYDKSGTTVKTIHSGASSYGGEAGDSGDFVYSVTASSQTDLLYYDSSADTSENLSNVTGNDVYRTGLANGDVIFTRVPTGQTNADLYYWDRSEAQGFRLTTTSYDHDVLDKIAADRR